MNTLRRALDALSSLKLTMVCLAAAFVLVFAGTLAQVRFGLFFVQEEYFQSWIVWWQSPSGMIRIPAFPGGHFIGAVLLANLVAAHIRIFTWSWQKIGSQLTHLGLIVMLAGGLATDLFSVHSYMRIREGESKNYSEDAMRVELAVVDVTDPLAEQVTAIPGDVIGKGGTIDHASLPFRITIRSVFRNSKLQMIPQSPGNLVPAATMGTGQRVAVASLPRATRLDDRDVMSAVIEILPRQGESLGTWLVSDALAATQEFETDGRKWSIQIRPTRYYKPYGMKLLEFTHETYPGTGIPKNFSSKVVLNDPEVEDSRQVLIYMNHPLRYRGDTYYQSGYDRDNSGTVLQVVRNPSYQAPYVACLMVSLGLLYQFTISLAAFARKSKTAPAP
jgi:hypothetical protein